jgi:hypothetical protein
VRCLEKGEAVCEKKRRERERGGREREREREREKEREGGREAVSVYRGKRLAAPKRVRVNIYV